VLILLPPSEGKTAPAAGTPLDLATLSLPTLTKARERVLAAVVKLSRGREKRALEVLGLGPKQVAELERNRLLREAPAAPAIEVYTGVLYEALDFPSLTAPAQERAGSTIRIASGLWGMVTPDDRIPAYRCSIGVQLPVLGGLTAYWKKALAKTEHEGLVIDLRSDAYAKTWKAGNSVGVRVLQERDGKRSVVSHFNKATKGRILRDLLQSDVTPRTPRQLADALRDLKYTVDDEGDRLDVIVREL
jgi:cytoplasmic iron level regulating protein YaaA (DUF328/UPF0246 family)